MKNTAVRPCAVHMVLMLGWAAWAAALLAGCPSVTPPKIAFGTEPVGKSSPAWPLTLNNETTASLDVTSMAMAGTSPGDYRLTAPPVPFEMLPGTLVTAAVEFKPLALGIRSATLEIASSASSTVIRVPLSGQGVPPAAGGRNYANDGSLVGTNLSPISDWSPEWAFLDCFKTSREWFSGTAYTFQDNRALALDANGWVKSLLTGQYAKTLLFWPQNGTYPSGDYVVLYEGVGKLEYRDAATRVQSAPGRDVVRVDATKGGWQLWITETNPDNYLRNIRVIMPGGGSPQDPFSWWKNAASCPYPDYQAFEKTHAALIFHPAFLKTVRSCKTLRFMDWMSTNNSTQQEWTDRPAPTDARWVARGVPVEILCALANTVHADPWFCIPHAAKDDYMRQFATVVRDALAPDLRAYVEYSNEVWNGSFGQSLFAQQQGKALGLSTDPNIARACYTARRGMEMFAIFSEVLGGTQRMRRVQATQAAGWYLGEKQLTHGEAWRQADVLAIAPYFGVDYGSPENETATQAMTLDQLFASLNGTELPRVYGWIDANAALARKYGLTLAAYEGGQSLRGYAGVENNSAISALFDAANRDPRMGQVYTAYLAQWKSRGGGMFVHYLNCINPTKWGRWGALEHLEQNPTSAYKYTALQQFIENNR